MNIKYFIKGIRDACGIPLIGLTLSMFTFGAYLKTSNFSILQTFLSTFLHLHYQDSLLWQKHLFLAQLDKRILGSIAYKCTFISNDYTYYSYLKIY